MHVRRLSLVAWIPVFIVSLVGLARAAGDNNYLATILVSNQPEVPFPDPKLVNSWGIAATATSPWWVSNNGSNSSTLYTGDGVKVSLEVAVSGAPTGMVSYPATGTQFLLSSGLSARFIWAAEDGTISAWRSGTAAEVVYPSHGAIFKGLAIFGDALYATDFAGCAVQAFDGTFTPASTAGGFADASIPAGFCPFGIQTIGASIFVTYAKRNGVDDEAGVGNGFVRQFDAAGHLVGAVASRGTLNSPWGLALAPDDFGKFSDCLLVGNFGDGLINAYCQVNGELRPSGRLEDNGRPIHIDGLWGIGFGNGFGSGPTNVLYFTAGPDDESNGHFGKIEFVEK